MIIADLAFVGADFAAVLLELAPNGVIIGTGGHWKSRH
jgi:hypothetical protein